MYSEDQIKKVFWKTFHKSGEHFFCYFDDEHENEASTNFEWDVFKENLTTTSATTNKEGYTSENNSISRA